MADYAKWTEKVVSVTSLLLDPQNPRIPPSGGTLDQRSLIAELVEHDDVLGLAKDIAENGYAPIESLIALVDEDDSKTYVLEGNRRLAALKLLLSPESAPESALRRVRSLAKLADLDSIRKVRVLHAPSRQAAAPLIMQKHTRQQIERWSPLMQARFYRTLATAGQRRGRSVENLRQHSGRDRRIPPHGCNIRTRAADRPPGCNPGQGPRSA